MPENYGHGFICPICSKLVAEVNTKREWKAHVFTDLTPYICTDGLAPYARARTDYKSIRLKNIDHELRDFVWKHFQGVLTASVLMPLDQTSMSMYTCTWPTITKSQLLEITEEAPAGKPKASSVDHRQQSIDQKLISAAKEGHHDLARYFLQDVAPRANPNATDIHGRLSFLPMR
ncbi:hypothetical protein HYQ46_001820 [Verticillium longisporum]|nr:hypothetical protein HYQ46_001820 [Verticillium longisporum]